MLLRCVTALFASLRFCVGIVTALLVFEPSVGCVLYYRSSLVFCCSAARRTSSAREGWCAAATLLHRRCASQALATCIVSKPKHSSL